MSEKKRWRRSEYREARLAYWQATMHHGWILAADRDVDAAEVAGIDWLPEEAGLPGRIEVTNRGSIACCSTGDLLLVAAEGDRQPRALALSRAVVALWNAWGSDGDLRKKLEALAGSPWSSPTHTTMAWTRDLHALLAKPWEGKVGAEERAISDVDDGVVTLRRERDELELRLGATLRAVGDSLDIVERSLLRRLQCLAPRHYQAEEFVRSEIERERGVLRAIATPSILRGGKP